MGPEVAVLDEITFTVDAEDLEPMRKSLFTAAAIAALAAATAAGSPEAVIAACDAAVKECEKADQAAGDDGELSEDAKAKIKAAEDAKALAETAAKDAKTALDAATAEVTRLKAAQPAGDAAVTELRAALDTANATITELKTKIDAAPPAMDEAAIFKAVAARDNLAARLKVHVGVFDHADKTLADVVAYGIDKLGLKNIEKGHELTALDAYLQAKPVSEPAATGADASVTPAAGGKVAGYISGKDTK